MTKTMQFALALTAVSAIAPTVTLAQTKEEEIVRNSVTVFDQMTSLHIKSIPQALLADAEGLAIIPNVIKGSFVVGARHGKGVLLIRDGQGVWDLPVFVSLTGGNVGWQVGVQSTDLILVFKTRRSVNGILNGKLTLGADAAAAAGPVGRKAAAATDGRLQAEIYSYSRSRGLFAGVSVDGSVLRVESDLNAAYYGSGGTEDGYYVPESAVQLANKVAGYCQPTYIHDPAGDFIPEADAAEELPPPHPSRFGEADVVRPQLADAANNLSGLLDAQWMKYLAIPPEVFQDGPHPSLEAVQTSLRRLDAVAQDAKYSALAGREEFRRTLGLLQEYKLSLTPRETALRIPPPPVVPETESTSWR
jgi:lipid-binding SYLF domain-containing protein